MRASVACGRWVFLVFLLWAPKTRAKLSLEGHFYLDGCAFLSNVSATLELQRLNATADYALQLEARGSSTARLIGDQQLCKIPSGFLYHFTFTIEGQVASLRFEQVEIPEEEKEGVADLKEEAGPIRTCHFNPGQPVEVLSGYGFLSCRGKKDEENVSRAVDRWKKAIEVEEAEAKYYKGVLLGTVIACVAFVIAGCALCIVLRLKATERPPPSRPRRRASTPAASVQTRVTNDQNSSSQHPPLMTSSGNR
ncbi:uncharacterized protein [Macrobrachium rosenbergii]|uniref:uncharacterized protein n=1 Tax=Macrobrachium rosenbergii TaxID=79674 RepID=UPI0034D61CED